MRRQKVQLKRCTGNPSACPSSAAKAWRQIIKQARGLGRKQQLIAVNKFFNRWIYKLDMAIYGKSDYWATPVQFMKLSGDCEDYSIAKFYALRELGWKNRDLRIVALWDGIRGIGHAVLVVKFGSDQVVLDNISNLIVSHLRYGHYVPQYSVNETTRWSHVKKIKTRKKRKR